MYIYCDQIGLRKIKDNDPRLEDHVYSPPGMARFHVRRGTERRKGQWHYVYYAPTIQECLDKANKWINDEIAKLKGQIATLEKRLVVEDSCGSDL